MLSNKPYLVRAFYDWIVDNKCTPFVTINANFPHCKVPQEFIEAGQITLNISPEAVRDLRVGNDFLEFRASFSGVVHIISAPVKAVLAIYAQENGQGMFFDFEEDMDDTSGENYGAWPDDSKINQTPAAMNQPSANMKKRPSHLKLVE